MNEIKTKIQELLDLSKEETRGWEAMKNKINHQDDLMDDL